MATLGNSVVTLLDQAKRFGPDHKIAKICEMLAQTNEILLDMPFKEGNLPTGERITQRTSLPAVYWRKYNEGIAPSKSTTAQFDVQCAMLESYSEVDKDLAELNGDVANFRISEASAYLEAMNQEWAQTLFYGSQANPEEFVGFAEMYNSTSDNNGQNILLAGGAGADNSSVYLVGWGDNSAYSIYPKGSQAGLYHEDIGLVTVETTAGIAGNRMRAYQDHWQIKTGLVVKDWRYVSRIANIDISDLKATTSTQATTASTFLIDLMDQAVARMPSLAGITPVFYANRTVMAALRTAARKTSSSVLSVEQGLNQFGQSIFELRFMGIPVRMVDQLTTTESLIS